MNPSIDLRLASMIRALTDVIIPALGATDGLAAEQAQLVLGHLHVLRGQVDHTGPFAQLEHRAASSLGQALIADAGRGACDATALARLEAALAVDAGAQVGSLSAGAEAIRAAIEDVIRSSTDEDGGARLQSIVIEHERRTADDCRTWFAAMGWEGGEHRLPSIAERADGVLAGAEGA
jgi:hypothetical protein